MSDDHSTAGDMANPDSMPSSASAVIATKFTTTARRGKKKSKDASPQQALADFWTAFQTRTPGKITSVFPRRLYQQLGLQRMGDVLGWPVRETENSGVSTPTSSSWSAVSVPSSPVSTAEPAIAAPASASAATSYDAAAVACRAAVARIVQECHRTNEKFTDPEFNLEDDPQQNCLRGLVRRRIADGGEDNALQPVHTPAAVHRVDWIFEKPVFVKESSEPRKDDDNNKSDDKTEEREDTKDSSNNNTTTATKVGFSASDVQQGRVGDCWWIAAVATMAHRTDLMHRVCVARDEACGVYGFVFVQDGVWTPVVVDDNLYLHHADFCVEKYDASGQRARDHRQRFQRGSEALSFARCADANETWLPLLEKAFAKLHGDYGALAGGWCSEGMEDLTGGVSTTVLANRVLDKERLWAELASGGSVNDRQTSGRQKSERQRGPENDFVFGLSVMGCGCYLANHNGLTVNHCYSVLQAVEAISEDGAENVRLVKIRNPWGQRSENTHLGAWHGPWADGAKEWTPYWLRTLGHTFGDDGVFWMSFQDVLETFGYLHRTRLFDASWTAVQHWASLGVGWVAAYAGTHFVVDVKEAGLVVVVLSQLDDRYYRGLRGQYEFTLHFVLQSADGTPLSIVHTPNAHETRSISCEVVLPAAGRYTVRPQIKAKRDRRKLTEAAVVRMAVDTNPDKLRQVGKQYDTAHAKGRDVVDEDQRLEERRERRVQRARNRKAWHKAEKKRFREALAAWVEAREEPRLRREKRTVEKRDVVKDETRDDGQDGEKDEAKVEKDEKKDQKEDADIDPGPEPRPLPEPDFSDSELDAEDSDDLLDESDGEDEAARLRKTIAKKGWPFVDEDEKKGEEKKRMDGGQNDDLDDGEPWNAVCIVGLRVYAKDPAVTVELVKPEKEKSTGPRGR